MIEQIVRPIIQFHLFDRLAAWCKAAHLTPNHLTAISLVLGVMAPVALTLQWPLVACALLWASGLADVLDGSLARLTQAHSDWGAFFDNVSDRIVEFAVLFGLLLVDPAGRSVLCFAMAASVALCVTTFLLVGLFSQNNTEKSFYYSPGLIERAEAFVFFSAMILMERHFEWLALLFIILTLYTALDRFMCFKKYAQDI